MKEALSIWWDEKLVGQLTMDEHGDTGFTYDASWLADPSARPISHSLPKREEPFDRRQTRPYFAGLLPDETVREVVARVLGVSERNDFSLLKALGGDLAGALTILPEGETPVAYNGAAATKPLTDDELVQLIEALPKRPFLAGETGIRMSLAGAQTKLPVVLIEGKVALPAPGQPTTHILKPSLPHYPATTENEAFVMQLAAAIGLPVAPAQPCRVKNKSYLLVTRYDREADASGCVHRSHQEDFCQALGITPERKYASEGGPTFKACFALLREAASRPAIDVLRLLDAALFNLVTGNADAHGKNFSLLYQPGAITLAPLYDLICTVAYPELSPKSAMKIAGASALMDLTSRSWQKFSGEVEIGLPYLRRRIKEICQAIREHAPATAGAIEEQGFEAETLERYSEIVRNRAELVMTTSV
jgi:serine/threonine-protein kinase HipA